MSSRTVASMTSRTPDQPRRAPMVSAIGIGHVRGHEPLARARRTRCAARRPGRNEGTRADPRQAAARLHAGRDAGAAATPRADDAVGPQPFVGAHDRGPRDAQLLREVPFRGQARPGPQVTLSDQPRDGTRELLVEWPVAVGPAAAAAWHQSDLVSRIR